MKNCGYCGHENSDDAVYCSECSNKFVILSSSPPAAVEAINENNLPQRYSYNPSWGSIGRGLGVGVVIMALALFHVLWTGVGISLGAIVILLGLRLGVWRLVFPGVLELGHDALLLPSGFLRPRTRKVYYADIQWTRETKSAGSYFLTIQTSERAFEIRSSLLPNESGYAAIRDFVNSRVTPKEKPVPDPAVDGTYYAFRCSYSGSGEIYNYDGAILFRFKTLHGDPSFDGSCYGVFRLPDFVVSDKEGKEWLRVSRKRRLGHSRFVMTENSQPLCSITQRSILRTSYRLEFAQGPGWLFHIPLFTVFFHGLSDTGAKLQARLETHNWWYVHLDPGADTPHLLAALAFIHREHLRCN